MKRKILTLMISMVMLMGLVACGNKQNEVNKENKESIDVELEKEDATEDNKDDKEVEVKNELLTGTYKVPLQEIYVDTPPFHYIEEGYSQLYMDKESKYAAFVCLYKENETDEKKAWDSTFTTFRNSLGGYHHIEELNEVEEALIDVNGIATYRIKGTVKYGSDNLYIYGYSFVFNNFPCSIVGVVQDPEQPQEEIDNITEIVDAMMSSVRNKK